MNYWICRPGKKGICIEDYIEKNIISCAWQGFHTSWKDIDKKACMDILSKVKGVDSSTTSARNWMGQIMSFVHYMQIDDYVIVPVTKNKIYMIGFITGEYSFNKTSSDELMHYRSIEWISTNIDQNIFTQDLRYTLGAFRTIFKLKKAEHINQIISVIEGEKNGDTKHSGTT